jgi:catechol 2,3-dioxygenase-like lactoylglutathione lyase family enzyme
MFCGQRVLPALPAANLQRAQKFYADKLGLEPAETAPDGTMIYRCDGSTFGVYPSQFAGTAKSTAAMFETDNLDRDMRELRGKGVVFEEYDMGEIKTRNGVATTPGVKAAWFKDSEGNILAITQRTDIPH